MRRNSSTFAVVGGSCVVIGIWKYGIPARSTIACSFGSASSLVRLITLFTPNAQSFRSATAGLTRQGRSR
jgi:hypothetical protein